MATAAEFVNGDLRVRWAEHPDNVAVDSYQIEYECGADVVIHTRYATDFQSEDVNGIRSYADTLTLSENEAAGLTRDVTITVKTRDARGVLAEPLEWLVVNASNPAPVLGVAPEVATDFHQALITCTVPGASDFRGFEVHLGDDSGFAPSEATLVTHGPGPAFWVELPDDNPRWLRVGCYDVFGRAALTYSPAQQVSRQSFNTAVSTTQVVSDLQATYGDTISAAQSAADAAAARSDAIQARAEAIIAQGEAEGAADVATQQATLASNSATAAGNSADAALISEGNASTYATDAESAATASQQSSVSAQSAFDGVIAVTRNGDFSQGKAGWEDYGHTTWLAASGDWSGVLRTTAGINSTVMGGKVDIAPGSPRYRLRIKWRNVVATTAVQFYAGVFFYDAAGVLISGSDGTGNYPLCAGYAFNDTTTIEREVIIGRGGTVAPSPYGGTTTIPTGAAYFHPIWFYNYNNQPDAVSEIDYFIVEDVTESEAAAESASAAASSASSASSSSSAAGSSATAAQTARTGAETARGQAETFRNEAAQAVEDAEGHAATAAQHSGLSAGSATAAGNHASAAQGDAQTAQTQASAAAASSSAAEATKLSVEATYKDTILIGGDTDFRQGKDGWGSTALPSPAAFTPTQAVYHTILDGRSGVLEFNSGTYVGLYSRKLWPIDTSRKYRIKAHVYAGPNGSGLTYIGFRDLFADGTASAGNGAHHYNVLSAQNLAPGWHELSSPVLTGEGGVNSQYQFNPGAKLLQLQSLTNYNNEAGKSIAFDRFWIEDVTESETAAGHASAAQIAVTTAEAHADDAGEFATIASGHANSANTSAGQALTYRNEAATSRNDAQGFANQASTSAGIAANVGTGSLNKNPMFSDWPTQTSQTPPPGWTKYGSAGNSVLSRVVGLNGSPNALRSASVSDAACGIESASPWVLGATPGGEWLVVEAEVTLVAGDLRGSGVYLNWRTAGASVAAKAVAFHSTPDVAGQVRGAGVVGSTYRFRELIDARGANVDRYLIYGMTRWTGFGLSPVGAATLDWHRLSIRPATDSEIELRAARASSASIGARIGNEESVRASADAALGSRASTLEAQMAGTSGSNLNSRIQTVETVTTNGTFASASSLNSLTTTVNGHTSSISSLNSITTTHSGTLANMSQLSVANGRVTGWTSTNNPDSSTFRIQADKFEVSDGTTTATPLTVANGKVYLSNATVGSGASSGQRLELTSTGLSVWNAAGIRVIFLGIE